MEQAQMDESRLVSGGAGVEASAACRGVTGAGMVDDRQMVVNQCVTNGANDDPTATDWFSLLFSTPVQRVMRRIKELYQRSERKVCTSATDGEFVSVAEVELWGKMSNLILELASEAYSLASQTAEADEISRKYLDVSNKIREDSYKLWDLVQDETRIIEGYLKVPGCANRVASVRAQVMEISSNYIAAATIRQRVVS